MQQSESQLVGPLSQWVLDNVLVFFNEPDSGLKVAFVLVLVAFAVSVTVFVKSYFSCGRRISRVNKLLRAINGRREFSKPNVYESFSQKIESDKLLRRAWREFTETTVSPEELESNFKGGGRFRLNTRRPHEYFNPQVIRAANVPPDIKPSAFVGIGLLVTFLGLVAALTSAATAFTGDSGAGDQIEKAIGELLVVAGSKFFASIGGLMGSMLVALGHHFGRVVIAVRFAEMNELLEGRLLFVSDTEASIAQYKYAVNQSETLSNMKDELVADLGAQLGSHMKDAVHAIPPMLKEALDPMNSSITKMSDELINNAQQTSDVVAQTAADSMLGAMKDGLTNLSEKLKDMGENMDKVSGGLNSSLQELNKSIAGMESSQSGQSEKMVQELEKATKSMSTMFTETLGKFEEGFGGAATALSSSAQEASNSFARNYAGMAKNLREELDSASEEIGSSLKTNVEGIMSGLRNELKANGAELVKGVAAWSVASQNSANALDRVNDSLEKNRSALEFSAKAAREGGSSLQSTVNIMSPLAIALRESSGQIEEAGNSANAAINSLKADVAQSTAAVKSLEVQWQEQGKLLAANDKQLEEAFKQIAIGSAKSLDVLRQSGEEIDKLSTKVNEHFKSVVSELADAVSDFSDAANKNRN